MAGLLATDWHEQTIVPVETINHKHLQLWSCNVLHEEVTEKIIGASFEVHSQLGDGFLEKVYKNAM